MEFVCALKSSTALQEAAWESSDGDEIQPWNKQEQTYRSHEKEPVRGSNS